MLVPLPLLVPPSVVPELYHPVAKEEEIDILDILLLYDSDSDIAEESLGNLTGDFDVAGLLASDKIPKLHRGRAVAVYKRARDKRAEDTAAAKRPCDHSDKNRTGTKKRRHGKSGWVDAVPAGPSMATIAQEAKERDDRAFRRAQDKIKWI